jgi:hypothetical protein
LSTATLSDGSPDAFSPASTGTPATWPRKSIVPESARALHVKCLMFEAPLIQTRLSGRMGRPGTSARATVVAAAMAITDAVSQLALIGNPPGLGRRARSRFALRSLI